MEALAAKNLIRLHQGDPDLLGTVVEAADGGRRVSVRFDDGSHHTFVWPNEVLERVLLVEGEHVRVLASDAVGVVAQRVSHNGLLLYRVSLPGGASPLVMEDGLRPSAITDPLQRLRAGQLHS